jgi:hypothetical protein
MRQRVAWRSLSSSLGKRSALILASTGVLGLRGEVTMTAMAFNRAEAPCGQLQPADVGACEALRFYIADVLGRDVLRQDDVTHLWGLTFDQEMITPEVIEALFAIEGKVHIRDSAWAVFFTETIAHYVIWEIGPAGVVTGSVAEWLVGLADAARTSLALGLLAHIIAEAAHVPSWLPAVVRARLALFQPLDMTQ